MNNMCSWRGWMWGEGEEQHWFATLKKMTKLWLFASCFLQSLFHFVQRKQKSCIWLCISYFSLFILFFYKYILRLNYYWFYYSLISNVKYLITNTLYDTLCIKIRLLMNKFLYWPSVSFITAASSVVRLNSDIRRKNWAYLIIFLHVVRRFFLFFALHFPLSLFCATCAVEQTHLNNQIITPRQTLGWSDRGEWSAGGTWNE
jgi:hypothetical protein